ncbi:IS3 family transposase [Streptomyces sp. NPDC007205]|uniref:IS3 family transposase n=1 Tax=Streptomyces sp. NPDC007205 TaxID=3154316 RepID=UPI0033FE96D8
MTTSLWMRIKPEFLRGRTFTTRAEANLALFEYVNGFYNNRRIQERLGFLNPVEYEEKHYAEQATTEQANLNTHHPVLTSGTVRPEGATSAIMSRLDSSK